MEKLKIEWQALQEIGEKNVCMTLTYLFDRSKRTTRRRLQEKYSPLSS